MKDVHMVDWSQQPDLLFRCDGSWAQPEWKQIDGLPKGVYLADDGRLYTFDPASTTCSNCLKSAPRSPE